MEVRYTSRRSCSNPFMSPLSDATSNRLQTFFGNGLGLGEANRQGRFGRKVKDVT